MNTIGWIQIYSKKYGGVIYNQKVREALAKYFDLELINLEARYFKNKYLKIPESFVYLLKLKGKKDLWIRDFYSTITLPFDRTKGKNLVIVHHIDFSGFPLIGRYPFSLLEKLFFYRNLKRVDAIVTISEYWRNYFFQKGYSRIYKIYCGFDLENFSFSEQEISEFKKKHKLTGKPIVYIGNCQRAKGALDSYRALKNLDVHLVTSGRREIKIPARNFNLEYKEYLKLLRASDIAITMSKFKEGWCMTAHEAMLCKTPVIGSGKGGMRELLERGGQIICEDFQELKEKTLDLLSKPEKREKMGQAGFNFAKNFSQQKFEDAWLKTIHEILKV